jgi:hypothetical protein
MVPTPHPESSAPQDMGFGTHYAARRAELLGRRRRKPKYTLARKRRAVARYLERLVAIRLSRMKAAADRLEAVL